VIPRQSVLLWWMRRNICWLTSSIEQRMRFLELFLKAYGPFSDQGLDLSKGHEGLHVIYGVNEAGKSTALRAIHAFLFGSMAKPETTFVTTIETSESALGFRIVTGGSSVSGGERGRRTLFATTTTRLLTRRS